MSEDFPNTPTSIAAHPTLLEWCRDETNHPKETMIYKNALWAQVTYVRDRLPCALFTTYEEYKNNQWEVINTHSSKSIKFPVYQMHLPQQEITLTLRGNLYDYCLSIQSKRSLAGAFDDKLFNHEEVGGYFEGFPNGLVFPPYAKNQNNFSLMVAEEYNLYVLFYKLREFLTKSKE